MYHDCGANAKRREDRKACITTDAGAINCDILHDHLLYQFAYTLHSLRFRQQQSPMAQMSKGGPLRASLTAAIPPELRMRIYRFVFEGSELRVHLRIVDVHGNEAMMT